MESQTDFSITCHVLKENVNQEIFMDLYDISDWWKKHFFSVPRLANWKFVGGKFCQDLVERNKFCQLSAYEPYETSVVHQSLRNEIWIFNALQAFSQIGYWRIQKFICVLFLFYPSTPSFLTGSHLKPLSLPCWIKLSATTRHLKPFLVMPLLGSFDMYWVWHSSGTAIAWP